MSTADSGASARTGAAPSRIPRTGAGSTMVLAGIAALALAVTVVFIEFTTGSLMVSSPTSVERRPVVIALLVIAALCWEFTLTLTVVRIVQARQIMRRHRLENLATTWTATSPHPPDPSLHAPHPRDPGRRARTSVRRTRRLQPVEPTAMASGNND
jgi:hypothetical protein